MPGYAMVESFNAGLSREAVRGLQAEQSAVLEELGSRGSLVNVVREHFSDVSDTDLRYLASVPDPLQEAIRAAAFDGIDKGMSIQIQFRPGYDFEVSMWSYGDSLGIHLKGPFTGAPYPRESFSG